MLGIRNHDSVVQFSPSAHFFNDVSNSSLLRPSFFLSWTWARFNLCSPPVFLVSRYILVIVLFLASFSDTASFPLQIGIIRLSLLLSVFIIIRRVVIIFILIFVTVLSVLWTHFYFLIDLIIKCIVFNLVTLTVLVKLFWLRRLLVCGV